MEVINITPKSISIDQLLYLRNYKVKPIEGLIIDDITIPTHLMGKKRQTETADTLSTRIRLLFNTLTVENIQSVKEQLQTTIIEKAKTSDILDEVAVEILHNFFTSEQNIGIFMHLLNAVSNIGVLPAPSTQQRTNRPTVYYTIGNKFLQECKKNIFAMIDPDNIKKLALMDLDDDDVLDQYNKERVRILNLIITLCYLYHQRDNPSLIKLNAKHLIPLLSKIIIQYKILQKEMVELGNPFDGDECLDEDKYIANSKMCNLYSEQLYTFIKRGGKDFVKDPTLFENKSLLDIIEDFKTNIVPTFTESYLIRNCDTMFQEIFSKK